MRVIGLVTVSLIAGIVLFNLIQGAGQSIVPTGHLTPKVGDCVATTGTTGGSDGRIVACNDPAAVFQVLQVISGTNDVSGCNSVPGVLDAFTSQDRLGGAASGEVSVLCVGQVGTIAPQ